MKGNRTRREWHPTKQFVPFYKRYVFCLPCVEVVLGMLKVELKGGSGEWCEGGATACPAWGCGMGNNWLEYKSTVSILQRCNSSQWCINLKSKESLLSVEIVHFLLLVFYKYSSNYAKKGSQRLLYDHLSPSLSARKLNSPTFFLLLKRLLYSSSSGAFSYIQYRWETPKMPQPLPLLLGINIPNVSCLNFWPGF